MGMERKMEPSAILKKPYARIVVPETDGSFTAEILEFSGCVASGDTAATALANLEDVALDWIGATLEQGQNIPEPIDNSSYSGKLVLRMAKSLHKTAARFAARDGVSLNSFIVSCVSEHVGVRSRSMQAVFQPAFGVRNYFLSIGLLSIPQTQFGGPQQSIATTLGNQLTGIPMIVMQEQSHARS
jgi:antitoxin HicB